MVDKRNSQNSVSEQIHYTQHKIQHIQMAMCNGLDWGQANVSKYLFRWKEKNGLQDLDKAIDYLKCYRYNAEHGFDPHKFKTPNQLKDMGYLV